MLKGKQKQTRKIESESVGEWKWIYFFFHFLDGCRKYSPQRMNPSFLNWKQPYDGRAVKLQIGALFSLPNVFSKFHWIVHCKWGRSHLFICFFFANTYIFSFVEHNTKGCFKLYNSCHSHRCRRCLCRRHRRVDVGEKPFARIVLCWLP